MCLHSINAMSANVLFKWHTYLVMIYLSSGFDMAEKVVEIDNEPVRLQLW